MIYGEAYIFLSLNETQIFFLAFVFNYLIHEICRVFCLLAVFLRSHYRFYPKRERGRRQTGMECGANNCKCPRRSIILNCKGFHSAEPVDTSIFLKQGDVCLLQMGSTLPPGASVKFSYAWDPAFIMFPESAAIVGAC